MDMNKEATEGVVPTPNIKYEEVEHIEADAASDKRLVRKIDFHVIPILIILFTFSLMDRNIIATARVAGMGKALDLTGNRYSVALLVLFPLYILIELPTSFILRKISVKAFFFGMVFCWGIAAMCHAFVKTFPQLVAVRVLLGLFEGSFQVSISSTCFPAPPFFPLQNSYQNTTAGLHLHHLVLVHQIRNTKTPCYLVCLGTTARSLHRYSFLRVEYLEWRRWS